MANKYQLIASGYTSLDYLIKLESQAASGCTSLISNKDHHKKYFGGCSPNICYILNRLGTKALPIMRVGEDWNSNGYRQHLLNGGVPLEATTEIPDEMCSSSYILENATAEHITLYYPGAMAGKYFMPVDDNLFRQSSFALITVASREDNQYFFQQCRKHNLPLVFGLKMDANSFPEDFLHEIMDYSSIIFSNEDENNQIVSMFNLQSIKNLFRKGKDKVIITTQGKRGSTCFHNTLDGVQEQKIGTCPTEKAIKDYTGAGDSYIAGFLHGYFNNRPIKECCELGTVCASFIIEEMGCTTNTPTEMALYKRYAQWKGKSYE